MSEPYAFPGPFLTVERDRRHNCANHCLKRKFEWEERGKNGAAIDIEDHEMGAQEQKYNMISEKRPRFSNHQQESDRHSELGINGELNIDRMPVTLAIDCSNVIERGYNIGADSLLQNNLEWNGEVEETFGMDVECETKVNDMECTHVSKLHTDSKTVTQTSPFSKAENVEDEGSPAREFLLKHRPEYQMHCIPSYCHPGGLWDVMLEVYHGL